MLTAHMNVATYPKEKFGESDDSESLLIISLHYGALTTNSMIKLSINL